MLSTVAVLSMPWVDMRGRKKWKLSIQQMMRIQSVTDRSLSSGLVAVFKSMHSFSQAEAGNCFIFYTFQGFSKEAIRVVKHFESYATVVLPEICMWLFQH